ncbi:MAG: phage integrase SAM-like domain-containing protein, partial [Bacteroidales bacterium]|nr:phage integrase SAM-like domain-containing protein [Bacteroidales bacterium]
LKRISKIVDLEKRMEKVSYADLVKIESELLKDGVSANTISVYLRSMRSIYNKAIKMDLVDQIYYPFHKFAIKQTKTMPRNISLQDMQKYFALKLPFSHRYQKAYIIGKLIFLLCGINLKDLLLLNKDNIRGDRIVYQRSKTKRLYSVKILPETKMILEPMLKHSGETLLCVLDNYLKYYKDSISFEAKYTEKRKLINKHLKWISFFAYIDDKITSYTFRYSFANIAKDIGVSNEIIAALLGHSYGNAVTSIYLNNYNQEELDKAHEMIVNAVLKNPQI